MMENTEDYDSEHETIEEYLSEFLSKYEAQTISDVNCTDLGEEDFELLGDKVMETYHPGSEHEVMDRMMGGEGSESLKQMHINMGKSYLSCYSESGKEVRNMGYMMGGNINGWSGSSMMGGVGYLWGINILLVTVLLVVLIRYFWNKGGK